MSYKIQELFKARLTLNDLYDTTSMIHNRHSNFQGIYTIIQVVLAKSTKVVVLTDYSAFKSSRKMIQEQMQQVIIALTSEKKQEKEN